MKIAYIFIIYVYNNRKKNIEKTPSIKMNK